MAEHILAGQDIRGLFLIIDDFKQNAFVLTKLYANLLMTKNYNVQIVNESRPDILPSTVSGETWPPVLEKGTQPIVLVLHDLDLLVALCDAEGNDVVKDLLQLLSRQEVKQIVCVVKRDVSEEFQLKKLEYICSQRFSIESREADTLTVESLWKKPRGKAVIQKEQLTITGGVLTNCTILKDVPIDKETPIRSTSASATDLLADLTFNLRTSAEEKKAKDQLILPYTEVGQINYTLDREDDFDEEDDPDGDLDI